VQLPDEYDQIVSALSDWIAIAASTRGLTGACPDRTNHPLRLLPSILNYPLFAISSQPAPASHRSTKTSIRSMLFHPAPFKPS
jgi:hypothetical protein